MPYRLILPPNGLVSGERYETQADAERSARRRAATTLEEGHEIAVVWCPERAPTNPKLWLAYVGVDRKVRRIEA